MGVHGLTAFFKENRRSLSHTLELKGHNIPEDGATISDDNPESINIVVDGWSLIYAVFNSSGEPWVYGGENAALSKHVETVVSSWISVGIKPTFVFDGPAPPLKYPTIISRLQTNCVNQANLFFRTSPAARSTPRSLAETRIALPIALPAILSTLLSMGPHVKVEFADGEADPYIVALAGRLGAYVTGSDSDFLILHCEGYKGYIPLEEMTWTASMKDHAIHTPDSSTIAGDDDESGFQTVTKKKQKGKLKSKESRIELGTGVLPPSSPINLDTTLLLTIYDPATFAQHVSLPTSLLPLLGALRGNDYASFDFFQFKESPSQRVKRVADTLSAVLKEAQSGNAKRIRKVNRGAQGSVMDIIGTTVERLLLWRDPANPPASGQIEKITEMVVQSTLEYALDSPALLEPEDYDKNNLREPIPQSGDIGNSREQVRSLYLHAYRTGALQSRIIETFARGSCFPRLFLEDPDKECCPRSIGRPIREVIWSVLNDGGGIPEKLEPESEEDNENDQSELIEDEDELVDVVEEFSDDEVSVEDDSEDDPLAALRGKLQRLSFSGVEEPLEESDLALPEPEAGTPTSFVDVIKPSRPKVVTEYIRRGARVVGEDLEVRQLSDFISKYTPSAIPIQLRPMEERLSVFLQALGSDTHTIWKIASQEAMYGGGKLLSVVALRWVLKTLHARAEAVEDGNRRRERNKEKWTRSEAQAFLACLFEEDSIENPPIEPRAVQLTAQILAAFEACGWLAQALLLVDLPNTRKAAKEGALPVTMGEAEKMFSGRRFHVALRRPKNSDDAFRKLWSAVEEGLEDAFSDEKGKKGKKERRAALSNAGKAPTGMFGVLEGLDI